jgi:hypothetical protein
MLTPPGASGVSAGCVTGEGRALLRDIVLGPAGHYVDVRTSEYPSGALRGQIARRLRAYAAALPASGHRFEE